MTENDAFDARVVEDALAFIDAFCGTPRGAEVSALVGHSPSLSDAETLNLCLALRTLQHQLAAMLPTTVALNNTLLLQTPTTQLHEIQLRLDECRRLSSHVLGLRITRHYVVLEDPDAASFLRSHLDQIIANVVASASGDPLLEQGSKLEEVSDKYFDNSANGIAFRFIGRRFIPYKLSLLASVAWNFTANQFCSDSAQSQAPMHEKQHEILVRFRDTEDRTDGVGILRRVDLPDGSVLFCWASSYSAVPDGDTYAPLNESGNAKVHQFGWNRMGRISTNDTSSRSRVFTESVSEVALRSPTGSSLDNPARTRQLFEGFRTRMHDVNTKHAPRNRQMLENRMLEATLNTNRRS